MAKSGNEYFEDLASTGIPCPHEDAFVPDGQTVYYRYIKGDRIVSESFLPTQVNPAMPLPKECDACIQKSVSVYDNLEGLINGVFKLPSNKGKRRTVGLLMLSEKDGVLKKTFGKNHHSWWRSQAFDIAAVTVKEIQL